ncbi:hypothetical protein BDN71DRAFT_1437163 [Pleurotus eryngii]|uniref:Uncharacterized protein n=1 Tax=Pleurotus eryngii TaxID=5323 RepID=A0A9P5ZEY5_PLEER|nr:hypothetical protein BDN71DRAFT_1437163 [Pleurotus eryngii]
MDKTLINIPPTVVLLHCHDMAEVTQLKVADQVSIKVFEGLPKGPLQPNLDDFHPDLCSSLASLWNKQLGQLFAKDFVDTVAYECKDKQAVHDDAYVVQQDDLKTDKAAEYRHRSIRHRRKAICELFAKKDVWLQRFLPLWDSLPLEAMSGDKSDHRPKASKHYSKRYVITNLSW